MEFIQVAYCCSVPFLVLLYCIQGKNGRLLAVNLLAVAVFLLIGHSFFLLRQLVALYQLAKQWQLPRLRMLAVPGMGAFRLLLEILLPFLSFSPKIRKGIGLPVVLLVLLLLNHPLYTWNTYDLFTKIPLYLSLFCSAYALFWLLNLLPYQMQEV